MKIHPRILIIGESCLDEFIYCEANRLAPDIPVPILSIVSVEKNPGMAMNVFRNLNPFFPELSIETNSNWKKIKKTRYIDRLSNHYFFRIDSKNDYGQFNKSLNLKSYDGVIISDYNKGFLSEERIQDICKKSKLVFLDTKKILGNWALDADFIKINNFEYSRSINMIDSQLEKKIIRTAGEDGAYFQGRHFKLKQKHLVKDSSGAGDSFLAALVIKYYETKNIEKSIIYANEQASKVVSIRGVGTIS